MLAPTRRLRIPLRIPLGKSPKLFSPVLSRTVKDMRLIGVASSNLAIGSTVLCFGQNADGWVLGAG
jgi:hypothetical protein